MGRTSQRRRFFLFILFIKKKSKKVNILNKECGECFVCLLHFSSSVFAVISFLQFFSLFFCVLFSRMCQLARLSGEGQGLGGRVREGERLIHTHTHTHTHTTKECCTADYKCDMYTHTHTHTHTQRNAARQTTSATWRAEKTSASQAPAALIPSSVGLFCFNIRPLLTYITFICFLTSKCLDACFRRRLSSY